MKSAQSSRTSLGLETLEGRANPAAFISNGDLFIIGTGGNDQVDVRTVSVQGREFIQVSQNGTKQFFRTSQVTGGDMIFTGFAGNDTLDDHVSTLRLTASGGDGDDTLIGAGGSDCLSGNNGNDTLYGYGGNDTLCGGNGFDRLFGMSGNDTLDGGRDGVHDYLVGGTGADHFRREPIFLGLGNRDTPADFVSGVDSYF